MLCAPLLAGAACEKKTSTTDTGALAAIDRAEESKGPVDTTPLPGIDTSALQGDRVEVFYKLLGSLRSPCGKPHSLRTSVTQDTSCKRAPYAARYVLAMLADEFPEDEVRSYYGKKYEATPAQVSLDVSGAPRIGSEDAPVRLVEFFDYQCPACAQYAPILERVAQTHQGKVAQYFLMLPVLESRVPGSKSAAQAAIAASKQGKFEPMHKKLFASVGKLSRADVIGYARELGLDTARFEADYEAAAAQVEKDTAQARAADVHSTPTLFFNDRKYEGPSHPAYIGMWIDEELAVNR